MAKNNDGPEWRYKSVGLRSLKVDPRFQVRAEGLDPKRVKKYAYDMRRGDGFPAISVASVDGRLYVLDGFHRVEAARWAGLSEINAKIAKLTEPMAHREAIKANAQHGLNLNRKDKQNIFRLYLERGDHLRFDGSPKSLRQMQSDIQHIVTHATIRNWLKAEGITPAPDLNEPSPLDDPDKRFINPGIDEFDEALAYTEELSIQLPYGEQVEAMFHLLSVADRLANGETRYMEAIARSNLPLDEARQLDI